MSATKFGLPTSLTPQVLKQILRYEPRHWKALKARLVKEHPAAWEDIHLSGDDFYTKLHALLKDPVNRWALEAAAQKESTKNRPLTLCCEIRKHYEKSLRNEPSFYDRLPKRPTPKEFVNALADCGDSDRLANVIWAFAESGSFTCADLAKIGEEHPSVRTRLGGVVKGIDMEAKPVAVRWVECLSRMRDTLEMAEKLGPDSEVAADFVGHADDLQKLALDFDRAAKAWASLTDLIDKHRNVLSHHSSLKPYVRVLDEGQSVGALTQNAGELVEEIDRHLRLLARVADDILEKSAAMDKANAEKQTRLLEEMVELHKKVILTRSDTERLLAELFPGTELGDDAETPTTVVDAAVSHEPEDSRDIATPAATTQGFGLPVSEDADKKAVSTDTGENGIEVSEAPLLKGARLKVADCTTEGENSVGDETAVTLESTSKISGRETDADQTGKSANPTAATGDDGTPESPSGYTTLPQEDRSNPSDSVTVVSHQGCPSSGASEALDAMLSSGRFARAYWLGHADNSLGDPALLGALCEGARIGPGDSCPGVLTQFLHALAERGSWTDDERLLLCAAALGPCLFADPLPQGIYQLINQLPVESSLVGTLMQKVREFCVYQNTKIRPEDLGVELIDTARKARLDKLENDAQVFLNRVPYIRFAYAPADRALQFLYRAGSVWHRLHTIVGENQTNHLKEASSLVKNLDPLNVVASLHDETELVALKQPLEGRARDKLARHLHDTISLAVEWIRLTDLCRGRGEHRGEGRAADLCCQLEVRLRETRSALKPARGRGSVDALDGVLEDLEARIQGRQIKERTAIFGDLLLLPKLPLEDDFEPADNHLDVLRHAILEAEKSESDPREILNECLNRQEYRRARAILDIHDLGAQAHEDYEREVADKLSSLTASLNALEIEIEDAFLLGQLHEDAEEGGSADDLNHKVLERSQLLSIVREASGKLYRTSELEVDELREISRSVEDVSGKVKELASSRREQLSREFVHIMDQLPDTEGGQADRDYLRGAFEECVELNDDVAAFDLLDRGRRAVQDIEPVARASIGSSESLDQFMGQADGYREALTGRHWLPQIEGSIREGTTVAGIAFGQLDRPRRDEAISGLKTWHSLTNLRFPVTHDKLRRSMDELFRFIGLPLAEDGVDVADTTEAGLAHIRANLARPILTSPLPAFGSVCGDRFEIVVSQTRKEPQQVEEYIRGRGLTDKPVLVYLLQPEGPSYRLRWQRHCVRSRLTALPLDFTLFLHLCGARNRLPVLFEIGLPLTWSCPYITKGENVAAEMFVGRMGEAASLMAPTGSCIVFGGRQLGKSALLRYVRRKNHDPGMSTYITYLDVDDLGSNSQDHDAMMAAFWRRVYDELHQDGALSELPRKILDRASRLVEEVQRSISDRLAKREDMRIVLLLDESDDLLDCDSGRDFILVRQLRGLMARTERRFKVVFAGLQSVQRYNNWKNHPFAQLGSELVVNPLPPAAAQDLIIRPLRTLGYAFERAGLILRILSQTNYHPGLIQIFCYRLLENLYEKLLRQEHEGPIRRITDDDILGVERDVAVMEDIRNRFDWTLDLDDRYKVLTYALVLTPAPAAPRLESEFMSIGADWWPAVFKTMDSQSLRAVLDEMVGLGVLLKEHEYEEGRRRRYRLRSPNLLRLLGPQEDIESELERIIDLDHVSRANPRNFHPMIDKKSTIFGPLTNEQQGQISEHSRPFHLSIISGSEALGLGQVERQFDWLLSHNKDDGNRWKKITRGERMQADMLIKGLQKAFGPRHRDHRYTVIRLEEIEFEGRLSVLFSRFVRDLGQLCTNESRGHLVILVGPSDTWCWLGDEHRESVLAQSRVTGLGLRRWSDGAIANALDRLGARTGSKFAASEVFKRTSGFHQLVDEGLRRAKSQQGVKAENLIGMWDEVCGEALKESGLAAALAAVGLRGLGLPLEACVREVLQCLEMRDDKPVLIDTSFDLAAEELDEDGRMLLDENGVLVKEWMRAMGLAHPGSKRDDGSMAVALWVDEIVKTAGA